MREIKFRAWDEERKGFGYVVLHPNGSIHVPTIDIWARDSYSADHISFMNLEPWQQYTGLKDKNGKDIYEGDVVMVPVSIQKPDDSKEFSYYNTDHAGVKTKHCCKPKPCLTKWEESGYIFEHHTEAKKPFWVCDKDISKEYEIIGNIYENPELVKVMV